MTSQDLLALLSTTSFPSDELELRTWIKDCRDLLAGRSPDEVAQMAILVGFDYAITCRVFSNFTDAMNGTHIDNRTAFQAYLHSKAVEDFQKQKAALEYIKELDLKPMWQDVMLYQTGESK